MRILVTGANGFIGSALWARLQEDGHEVIGAVRGPRVATGQVPVGKIGPDTNWQPLLRGVDAVVHLAARAHVLRETEPDPLHAFRFVNTAGTLRLAQQAANAGVRRFVFLSSIGVNGNATHGTPFTEADEPNPQDAYAISKLEAEMGLRNIARQSRMEIVLIRPPLVYGPGARGNFARLVNLAKRNVPLPLGAIPNRRSLVGLDNLVSFISICLTHPKAANETFLISDGEDLSTTQLLRKITESFGRRARLIPVPASWLALAARQVGKQALAQQLLSSLVVDNTKARSLLAWEPVASVDEQLRKIAEHDSRS
jgi:Nucleoside-diphosphate-sugar epimerases